MQGNKIDINDIKKHEITLAKCGLLSLVAIIDLSLPLTDYEIRQGERMIYNTFNMAEALQQYNKLVIQKGGAE